MRKSHKPLAVITGCDSGIGKSLCSLYLQNDYRVVATYLDPPKAQGEDHIPLRLDLRIEKEITKIFIVVENQVQAGHPLKHLFLNSGIALYGPVEDIPLDYYRETLEVNLLGHISLIQKCIPLLIKSQGKIILHSSLAGKVALHFFSPYNTSKFAMEGFGESLRRELAPFGIQTTILNTGGIATPIWNKGRAQDTSFVSPKYRKALDYGVEKMTSGGNAGLDQEVASRRIYKMTQRKNLPRSFIVSDQKTIDSIIIHLPRRFMDWVLPKVFHQSYEL